VPINFIRLSTGDLIALATAENDNRRADVIWGAPGAVAGPKPTLPSGRELDRLGR